MMGFLLKPLSTVTSMREVSGGALYLRPCCSWRRGVVLGAGVHGGERDEEREEAEGHREGAEDEGAARVGADTVAEQHLHILRRGRAEWVGLEWCAGRLWSIRYDMSEFHSDFTPDGLTGRERWPIVSNRGV